MRGGVDSYNLMYYTDVKDIEIMNRVVEENIEASKKAGMPLI